MSWCSAWLSLMNRFWNSRGEVTIIFSIIFLLVCLMLGCITKLSFLTSLEVPYTHNMLMGGLGFCIGHWNVFTLSSTENKRNLWDTMIFTKWVLLYVGLASFQQKCIVIQILLNILVNVCININVIIGWWFLYLGSRTS